MSTMFYRGDPKSKSVFNDSGKSIDIAYHIKSHSKELSWGYCGSGPAQTAFAILLDFTQNQSLTNKVYQEFKKDIISNFEVDEEFILTAEEIELFLDDIADGYIINQRGAS